MITPIVGHPCATKNSDSIPNISDIINNAKLIEWLFESGTKNLATNPPKKINRLIHPDKTDKKYKTDK